MEYDELDSQQNDSQFYQESKETKSQNQKFYMMDEEGNNKHGSIESIETNKEIQQNLSNAIHNHRVLKKTLPPQQQSLLEDIP